MKIIFPLFFTISGSSIPKTCTLVPENLSISKLVGNEASDVARNDS